MSELSTDIIIAVWIASGLAIATFTPVAEHGLPSALALQAAKVVIGTVCFTIALHKYRTRPAAGEERE